MAEELENDVTELGESVEEDGISGNLKDYTFEPGRIEEGSDPENKGRIKVVTVSGSTPNEYWCYPWVMPNHAAYSEPVKGSDVWVFRNNRNSREGWYWLACTMHNLAQTYVDDNAGGGTDVISSRNHGSGSSSLTQSSGGGYTMSSPKAKVNVGGGGSNASIKTSSGSGVSAKGEKTTVGNESKGSEPAVLGDKLTNLLTMFIQKVAEFIACLPVPGGAEGGGVVEAEEYCNQTYLDLSEALEMLGMGDILSDNVDISANQNLADALNAGQDIEQMVDNMTESQRNDAMAKMFNDIGYAGSKWNGKQVKDFIGTFGNKGNEFFKEGLKNYLKTKKGSSGGNLSKEYTNALNETLQSGAKLAAYEGLGANPVQFTEGGKKLGIMPAGMDKYSHSSGKEIFNNKMNVNYGKALYEMDKQQTIKDAQENEKLAKEHKLKQLKQTAENNMLEKYAAKGISSKQLDYYTNKEYNKLVNEYNKEQAEKERQEKVFAPSREQTEKILKNYKSGNYDDYNNYYTNMNIPYSKINPTTTSGKKQSWNPNHSDVRLENIEEKNSQVSKKSSNNVPAPDYEYMFRQDKTIWKRDKNGIYHDGQWVRYFVN